MQVRDSEWIQNRLEKMADQIIGCSTDPRGIILAGIRTRGPLLAQRLSLIIHRKTGQTPLVGAIDIRLQRDDFHLRGAVAGLGGTDLPVAIDGREVFLIDDVLFTGRTIRAALNELLDYGRASRVRLAVLIDRGGRELPIHADICGEVINVGFEKKISVRLKDIDGGSDTVEETSIPPMGCSGQ